MYAPAKTETDKTDREMYEKEFFRLLEADFEQEHYQVNLALIENAKNNINNKSDAKSGQIGVNPKQRRNDN